MAPIAGTRAPLLTGWNGIGSSVPIAGTRAPLLPKLPARVSSTPTTAPVQTPQMTLEDWLRAESSKWLQAQIDAINAQKQAYLDDLKRQQDLEIARGQELAKALQGLNIPGRIQEIYGNASADIGGLAQAFSGELRDTASADAAQQTRMLSGTGQEGAVVNNGAALGDVLYGSQGYIPGRNASETGAAFASQAALEPGFAQRIGQVKGAEVYQQGLEGLKQFTDAILEANAQRPQIEDQLYEQYLKRQEAQQPELTARTLADGRIQYFDDRTGEPVGPPQGPKRSSSSGAAVRTVRLANGQYQAVDPTSGRPMGKPFGPAKAPSASSSKLTARSLANGQIQWFDPETGQPVGAPQGPKRATTKKGPGGKSYNLQLKTLSDGSQQWFDPRTGRPVGPKISPPDSASRPRYTAAQMAGFKRSAGEIASDAWNGVKTTQIVNGERQEGFQHLSYQEAMREGLARGVPLEVMQRALNRYWTKPGYDYDFVNKRWVKSGKGRPLRSFQERNPFRPGGGYAGTENLAKTGANIAARYGLSVISSKRDTKMTASGGVSDHWKGSKNAYAVDLSNGSSPTPEMDAAAKELVSLFGDTYDGKSELVRNYYKNGYRYQIIYRSNVGGNHFNHIHFGVRKVKGGDAPNDASGQMKLQGNDLVEILKDAGFRGEGLKLAYGIVMRESGGRPTAYNGNTGTGDRSYGLFQINMLGNMGPTRSRQFGLSSYNDLFDPVRNARAAYLMSKGGTDFGPWGIGPNAYRSGAGYDTIAPYVNQFPGG